jgi:hypothetical protein
MRDSAKTGSRIRIKSAAKKDGEKSIFHVAEISDVMSWLCSEARLWRREQIASMAE